MRNATCVGTQTSKIPTRVTLLLINYSVTIPFLDVPLVALLEHKVHRKPTHTDRYLHSNSFHHPSIKNSVCKTLINQGKTISTRLACLTSDCLAASWAVLQYTVASKYARILRGLVLEYYLTKNYQNCIQFLLYY